MEKYVLDLSVNLTDCLSENANVGMTDGHLCITSGTLTVTDLCIDGDYMDIKLSLAFDDTYTDTALALILQNKIEAPEAAYEPFGRLLTLSCHEGLPSLTDPRGRVLARFEKDGHAHTVRVRLTYTSNRYSIYCDDALLADDCTFISPVYRIFGLRLVSAGSEDSRLSLYGLSVSTEDRTYAQEYSYQVPGPMPEVRIPDMPPEEGITVWHNGKKLDYPTPLSVEGGTVYLSLAWITEAFGAPKYVFELNVTENTLSCGRKTVALNHPVREEGEDVLVPAQFIALVYSAKLWLDEAHEMLIVTTGKEKNNHILRKYGYVLVMDGEPYYEISFNKFDLNWQIAGDPVFNNGEFGNPEMRSIESCLIGAKESLSQLKEHGFKTIRVFCNNINFDRTPEEIERYFKIVDLMYDMCDEYGIQVVACLGLGSPEHLEMIDVEGVGRVNAGEKYYDLMCDPNSASRQNLYEFLDTYVARYKDRDTILMWEVTNEGNLEADIGFEIKQLRPSLAQLGAFYRDVANRIRATDPERLVVGGDSILRPAQYHLFKSVMDGVGVADWTVDSWEDRLYALALLHEGLDVISLHGYGVGYCENYIREDGVMDFTNWKLFHREAKRLGLGLYNGETYGMLDESGKPLPHTLPNTGDASAAARVNYLANMVDEGVQLSHWWAFHSNRLHFNNDVDSWSIRTDDETAGTFFAIKAANEALQARYKVNPLADENRYFPAKKKANPDTVKKTAAAFGIAALAAAACGFLVYKAKKNKKK